MNNFKWHLLNIQCITFVETFYFCFLCAPQILTYPLPHGYPTGVLTTLFSLSTNIQGGISMFFVGEMMGAICIAFVIRYNMLMPRSEVPFIQSYIQTLRAQSIYVGYGNGFVFGIATYMSFLDEEGVDLKLHQADPAYVIPKGATSIGGVWVYIWAGLALLGYAYVSANGIAVVLHSKRILKASAQLSRSVDMHQQAFRSLVLQTIGLYGMIVVPCCIVSVYMIFGSPTPYISDFIASFCIGCYTLKSICSSVVICYTIRPYREHIIGFFRCRQRRNIITVSSLASS